MNIKVTRAEPTPPPVTEVTITLTQEEAEKLAQAVGRCASSAASAAANAAYASSAASAYDAAASYAFASKLKEALK